MTDRAVQPEAPTTESGRALLMLAETHNLDCADPAACCFPAYIADGERIVAIEAEAYRQGWDANTATSFGNRAASQERPQPHRYESGPLAGICRACGAKEFSEAHGVAQERPSIDVDSARTKSDPAQARTPTGRFLVSQGVPEWQVADVEAEAVGVTPRTGGSVASPEPSE
jgi:hypothetical protein